MFWPPLLLVGPTVAAEVNTAFGALYYQSNFGLMYTHYIIYTLVIIVLTVTNNNIYTQIKSHWSK